MVMKWFKVSRGNGPSVEIEEKKTAAPDRLGSSHEIQAQSIPHVPASSCCKLSLCLSRSWSDWHVRKQGVHDLGISWSLDLKQRYLQFSMPVLLYSRFTLRLASYFLHLLSDGDLGTVKHQGFLCDMLGVKMKTGQPRHAHTMIYDIPCKSMHIKHTCTVAALELAARCNSQCPISLHRWNSVHSSFLSPPEL